MCVVENALRPDSSGRLSCTPARHRNGALRLVASREHRGERQQSVHFPALRQRWWPPITMPSSRLDQDRLDEAELAQAPGERIELLFADPPRVHRVRPEVVDRDLLDGEGGDGLGHRARTTGKRRPESGSGNVADMRCNAQTTAGRTQRTAELNRRLRLAFIQGAEERSRLEHGRGLTGEELRRVLRRYPGDLPDR